MVMKKNVFKKQAFEDPFSKKKLQKVFEPIPVISNDPQIQKLFEQLINSENPLLAIQAVYSLGELGSDGALDALLKGLVLPDSEVKLIILDTLSKAEFFNEKIVGPVSALLSDEDTEVILQAIELLGTSKSKDAVPSLINLLNDEMAEICYKSMEALAAIGDLDAVKPLERFLESKKWEDRYYAVDALGMLGDPNSVEKIAETLQDSNPKVREMAALSVGLYNSPLIIDKLMRLLNDSKPEVQAAAIYTLGEMRVQAAVPTMLILLDTDLIDIILVIIEALTKIRDPTSIPALIDLLDFPALDVVKTAQQALDVFESAHLIEPFIHAILYDEKVLYLLHRLDQVSIDKIQSMKLPTWAETFLNELKLIEKEKNLNQTH
jgi:HEAT repeat protein